MTLRLTVWRAPWRAHIAHVASTTPGLVPVVKGHGYGLGQDVIMPIAAELGDTIGVGVIHEAASVPSELTPVVLTPVTAAPGRDDVVLTVGSLAHVEALSGWRGAVIVKLASTMHRYGVETRELPELLAAIEAAGLHLAGYSVHPPTATSEDERVAEIDQWARRLAASGPCTLAVSHLQTESYLRLRAAHPGLDWRLRAGTALWHGDKSSLRLSADVLDTRPVAAGQHLGYHQRQAPHSGTLVMVGAGAANGVVPLTGSDGAPVSPFHHARRRLHLVEIQMHSSMVLAGDGDQVPAFGDAIDVQRPLIGTTIDELVWR